MENDIFTTDKGKEIEIAANESGTQSVAVRICNDKKQLKIFLDHSELRINSGKLRAGSVMEKIITGRIVAIKQRLSEI